MKYYLAVLFTVFSQIALAQEGWNWPDDSVTARRKVSIFPEMIETSNFAEAKEHFAWLMENAPDLNVSLYINGIKLYDSMTAKAVSEDEIKLYSLQLMNLYDQRIQYFGQKPANYLRKAYSGYKLFKDDKTQLLSQIATTDSALYYNKELAPDGLFLIAAAQLNKAAKWGLMTDDEVLLQRFDQLLGYYAAKEQADEETEAKLYSLMNNTIKLDCAKLKSWLMPQLLKNPSDTVLA
ncbi:MAG: hypothetical protein WBA74_22120, partial [Cyclobacteriaceae bacterium]